MPVQTPRNTSLPHIGTCFSSTVSSDAGSVVIMVASNVPLCEDCENDSPIVAQSQELALNLVDRLHEDLPL